MEENYNELAIVFNYQEKNQMESFIPFKVVEGIIDCDNDVFVDTRGNSYIHLIDVNFERGFGLNEPIYKLKEMYPNMSLDQIKKEYLKEAKKYNYYVGIVDNNMRIIIENKKTKDKKVFVDKFMSEFDVYSLGDSREEEVEEYDDERELAEAVAESRPVIKKDITKNNKITFSKKEIKEQIKKDIIGQDNAINRIMTIIFEHYNSNINDKSENILVVGPTGSGKTQIFRSISKLLNVPILIIDSNDYTAEGYVGKSVNSILEDLLKLTNGDLNKAENAILVIDEIDKLASHNEGNKADVKTDMVQQALLKIIEDGKKQVYYQKRRYEFDTTHLLTVGLGAFSGLTYSEKKKNPIGFGSDFSKEEINKKGLEIEDLTKYGLIPEFLGRFSSLVVLNELTEDNLFDIMKNSNLSIMKKKERYLKDLGIDLTYSDEVLKKIARLAIKNKEGARSLNKTLNDVLFDALDELTDAPEEYNGLEILPETVEDSKKYVLKRK